MHNPFVLTPLAPEAAFCDRQQELALYRRYAQDGHKVVIFSPRRYGKTSLVRRLQHDLAQEGMICPYVDFSIVTTPRDVALLLMEGFFSALHARESFLDKGKRFLKTFKTFRPAIRFDEHGYHVSVIPEVKRDDMDLLRDAIKELAEFITRHDFRFCFVFDEFQQVTRIRSSVNIEAVLRSSIQFIPECFFFVGSRRRILLAMFTDEKRPFYKMANIEELPPLPESDVAGYLQTEFAGHGKTIPPEVCSRLAQTAQGYAYYVQYLAQQCFYLSDAKVTDEHLDQAVEQVLSKQHHDFAAITGSTGFPLQQLKLLKALAQKPWAELGSAEFIAFSGLAASTSHDASRKLVEMDLIEQDEHGIYHVVDPFFAMWLRRHSAGG